MKPTEIRAELLGQQIRTLMQDIRDCAVRAQRGEPVGEELQTSVARLADAIAMHNAREEELLRPILPTVDAWGQVRADTMTQTHQDEHEEFQEAVRGIPRTSRELAGAGVEALFDRMLEHMAREERVMLAEDVLCEDTVIVEMGG
jgi:DUF438 domain-containing protein